MKIKVICPAHDTTIGKVYEVVPAPSWSYNHEDSVWVIDDVGEAYILYKDEYEVVE